MRLLVAGLLLNTTAFVAVVYCLLVLGCGDVVPAPPNVSSLELEEDRHWHERYVEDNCARCPDCCITIVASDDGAPDSSSETGAPLEGDPQ